MKTRTPVSNQFGPFATQTMPATVNEAPYILDGLLMIDAGQKTREQYADTGGFTDHVFAVTALPGFQFTPRIRDLPAKRLGQAVASRCRDGLNCSPDLPAHISHLG